MAVGEIFLAAFLQVLLETLTRRDFLDYVGRLGGVGKKLLKWREMLPAVAAVLYDAEEKQLTSKPVELWLNDLKHLAYDIDDLLHTFSNEMLERDRQVRGFFTKVPHKIKFNYNMNSEIKEIDDRLKAISDLKEMLGLKYIEHTSSSSHRTPGSYVLDGPVIGRDEDKRKIVELLSRDVDSPTKYQVVAIVGMAGLGKTTLAGQVFNDATAMKQFDLKIWVSVSDRFNLETVTKAIDKKVPSQPCDKDDLSDIQHHLSTKINGKRFLIVLDDVWSTCDYDSWTKLQAPFRSGAQGSKVMVTTRDDKVAKMMGAPDDAVYYLKTLSDETCLQLVEQHANHRPPIFELLEKKIITNCKGLPLAAKLLGGVLRSEDTGKWEKILDDKLWSTSDESKILPVLRVSYQYLPSTLKRCFAYCSILPNDYEFQKDELICLWMAEGFLEQPEGSKAMEDIGEEYFGKLLSRSLLQNLGESSSFYVMHDLVGDLARWAAGDTYSSLDDKPQGGCSLKTRHMAYISGKFDGRKRFETVSDAKHLRSFLPFSVTNGNENYLTHYVASDLLLKLKYLRVLSFGGYKLTEVPDSVGNVRHLRYLNLSGTLIMSLPESICTLYNLQTLMLVNCSNLKILPSNLSNLSNLRHLYNSNTHSLEEMPPQVSQLTHLRTLAKFVVGNADSASGIGEIGSLNLHGDLSIGRLENVIVVGDAERAKITNKEGLDTLHLEWSGTGQMELEVLCSLEPHKKLLELTIKGYNGSKFSEWIGHRSFSDMTFVRLENCKNCRFLPPLGQLPNLKTLHIQGLASVESVDAEFYGDGPFPVLETLEIKNMPVWKKWLPCKRNEENFIFPCLRNLTIDTCPKLKGLPPINIDSLSTLIVCDCEQLVVSIANYKHLCVFMGLGCKRLVHRSGVKFESLELMGLASIPGFRLEIDGFIRGLTKLQVLWITGGEELTSLWESEDRWLQHRISDIVGGSVSQSPCSHFVQHLRSLQRLEIFRCSNLICFPDCGLPPSLEYLKIESCDSLTYFVRFQLPSGIRMIEIAKCQNLRVLVKDAVGCSSSSCCLEALSINECASFTSLSGNGGRLPRTLKYLWIIACEQLESIMKTFHEDTCLEYIQIEKCANLKSLPEGLCHLSVLHTLMIEECGSLVSFPRGGLPSNLARLSISECDQLEALPRGIDNCSSLQTLEMGYCEGLSSILEEGFPPNLISLLIIFPKSLKPLSEWGLHHWDRLASLKELKLAGVDSDMVSFPPKTMLLPKSLIKLCIGGFPNLKRLSSSFQSLTSLEYLDFTYCPNLASVIPEQADHLPLSITQLRIYDCPLIRKRYQPGKGRYWRKVAYIPYVSFGDDDDEAEAEVDHPHN